tara:strand:- start:547 stop:1587 length:1041 start_codon:yes stop_codon:yes gene_type:complete
VIGGGFYGCNLAINLKQEMPDCIVDLYEKNDSLLLGAIGNCQNRLHMGFHYGRCGLTVQQSSRCFNKFLHQYKNHTSIVKNNFYLIHNESKVRYQDYVSFMRRNGLMFEVCGVDDIDILTSKDQFEGAIKVPEMVFDANSIKSEIQSVLSTMDINVYYNSEIGSNQILEMRKGYDYVINATYTQPHIGFKRDIFQDLKFEACAIPIYHSKQYDNNLAITVMDGEFCSLYPTSSPGHFTLSSVTHTPFFKSPNLQNCIDAVTRVKSNFGELENIVEKITDHSKRYIKIYDDLRLSDVNLTVKCKIKNDFNDSRECFYVKEGNYFSIMAGKVSAIYDINHDIVGDIKK